MIVGIASMGVIASAASAAPIPLTNPSFETASSTDSTKPAGWSASPQKPAEIVWTRSASNAVNTAVAASRHRPT